jgi:hypothetical protein
MKFFRGLSIIIAACLALVSPNLAFSQQTQPVVPPVTTPAPPVTAPAAPVTSTAPAAKESVPAPIDPKLPDLTSPDTSGEGGMSIGEIPDVKTEELTADLARKALDAYVLVQSKYQDSPLENYDDLQGFVDKDPKGKDFEADIKSFGFPNVDDWNLAVTTLSFAYTNAIDDQTADIKQQIDEVTASKDMAQDMKDRMVTSLKAMIPSPNNAKIVADLIADPVYGDKIKLLETTEE